MAFYEPQRAASEDDASVAKLIGYLQDQKRRRQADTNQVRQVDKTLADRRNWIIYANPQPTIQEVSRKYPWLFGSEDQVCSGFRKTFFMHRKISVNQFFFVKFVIQCTNLWHSSNFNYNP